MRVMPTASTTPTPVTPDQRSITWTYTISSGSREASGMRFVVNGDPLVGSASVVAERLVMKRGLFSRDWKTTVDQQWTFNSDAARAAARTALDAVYGWAALKPVRTSEPAAWERPDARTISVQDVGTWSYGFDRDIPNADALDVMHGALASLLDPADAADVHPGVPAAR